MYINTTNVPLRRSSYTKLTKDPLVWLNPPLRLDPNNFRDLQAEDIPIGSQRFSPSETPEGCSISCSWTDLILIGT
ncbi:hypothetical protein N7453_002858 [Penicillium expansum]|nr:hypothetical protein N7453_002858 [Penicillium expansum]